jgi:putative ABC transport system substrate-binding protein
MNKTSKIRFRAYCYAFALVAATLPFTLAEASIPRLGIIVPESSRSESQVIRGLREQLKENGYHEGINLSIVIRDAKGDRNALKSLAGTLVNQKPAAIFTTGTRASWAAKEATNEIPIIFVHPANPVSLGLVKSLERPGANMTGVAGLALQMTEKRMEIFKEIIPPMQRVHIFYDLNNEFSRSNLSVAEKAARKLGLHAVPHGIKSVDELKATFATLQVRQADTLFHMPDDLVEGEADFVFDTARQKRLPTMFHDDLWASRGALAAYGPSYYHMGRQAARLVEKILRGQKPENLSVEPAEKFQLVINYRTVKAMGLKLSPALLKKADKVIR